jgi:signal transduction histidine kinase
MTYRGIVIAGALGPLVLALLALAAWITGFLRLASVRSDYIPMAPSTAIGFVLLSGTLIAHAFHARPATGNAARAAAGLVSLLAVIKLVEFFTGAAVLNLEAVLVAPPGEFGAVPLARMSPLTSVTFLGAGLALVLLARSSTTAARDTGGILGGLVALAGATVVLGYLYGAPLLYGGRIIPMALTTALAFMGTGIALVVLAGPASAPLRPFCRNSARARLLRVFLPLTVIAVVANGILTNVIRAHVQANPALLAAVFALASAVAVGTAVSWTARALGDAIDRAEAVMQQSREELEQRVRERTAELSALNRELESFSYSVSHDLRAPLRAINGFSQALLEDYAERLDGAGRDYLQRVHRAADRMGELIDDLLQLSRVGRSEIARRPTNLSDLARTVGSELRRVNSAHSIALDVDEGVIANADPRLMKVVLENLLGNAWKFTANTPRPTVQFRMESREDGPVYFVRDNGAGFDMAYATKLFQPFQRLHSEAEFPGTGIGLATARRIIDRHGGAVWADSAVGRGATVYFTIPPAARERRA